MAQSLADIDSPDYAGEPSIPAGYPSAESIKRQHEPSHLYSTANFTHRRESTPIVRRATAVL